MCEYVCGLRVARARDCAYIVFIAITECAYRKMHHRDQCQNAPRTQIWSWCGPSSHYCEPPSAYICTPTHAFECLLFYTYTHTHTHHTWANHICKIILVYLWWLWFAICCAVLRRWISRGDPSQTPSRDVEFSGDVSSSDIFRARECARENNHPQRKCECVLYVLWCMCDAFLIGERCVMQIDICGWNDSHCVVRLVGI